MNLFPNDPGLVSKLGIVLDVSATPKNLDTTGILNGELLQYDSGSDRIIRGSQAAGAQTGLANVFTAKQTFNVASTQASFQDGAGREVVDVQNIGTAGNVAGGFKLFGTNGLGVNGEAWQTIIDVAAPTPYRDYALATKWKAAGGVSDLDGIYISHGGTGPAMVGMGMSAPADAGLGLYRLGVTAAGSGGSFPDATQGGLLIPFATGQTGDMLNIGSSNSQTGAFRVRSDGTLLAHASKTADLVVADAVTNATTTVTSATANFQSTDVGRYASGTNIPSGAVVVGFVSATQITLNLPASGSNGAGSLTLYGRAYQLRGNGNLPYLTIGSIGGGGYAAAFGDVLTGVSIGVISPQNIPSNSLAISGGSGYATVHLISSNAGGGTGVLRTNAASPLQLSTNATARLTIGGSGGLTIADANDLAVGTVTGTKIGTVGGAAGQKLAFWGAAPIVQPVLATGAGHTADDIITAMQTLGLFRQA